MTERGGNDERQPRWKRIWREEPDRVIELIFAGAIVFFSLMSWKGSESASQQTDQLIAAAKLSAYAAKQNVVASRSFASSAAQIKDGVDNAVARLQSQASNTQDLADATRDTVQTAQRQLLISERPWVVASKFAISEISIPQWGGEGSKPLFSILGSVTFANTGRSVASSGLSYFWILPNLSSYLEKSWDAPCKFVENQRKTISDSSHNPWPLGFLLAPNDTVDIPLSGGGIDAPYPGHSSSGVVVSPDMGTKGSYYIIGCTLYDDQLGVTHHTQWCFEPKRQNGGPPEEPLSMVKCQAFQRAD